MTWSALKKKTLNVREKVSIMQQTEMKHIRQDSERFGKQVEAFRDFFKEKAPTRAAGDMVDVADVEPRVRAARPVPPRREGREAAARLADDHRRRGEGAQREAGALRAARVGLRGPATERGGSREPQDALGLDEHHRVHAGLVEVDAVGRDRHGGPRDEGEGDARPQAGREKVRAAKPSQDVSRARPVQAGGGPGEGAADVASARGQAEERGDAPPALAAAQGPDREAVHHGRGILAR